MPGSEFGSFRHLAGRFFAALSPAGPAPSDERWARGWLLPGEDRLWLEMSGPDRRHAVGVARHAIDLLGPMGGQPDREVVAAALLHDVGKVEAGLGTLARAGVTLAAMAVGRSRLANAGSGGWRRRVALYLTHDVVGGRLLRQAGSDPFTWSWAEQHHLPPSRWTLERRLGSALKEADGD